MPTLAFPSLRRILPAGAALAAGALGLAAGPAAAIPARPAAAAAPALTPLTAEVLAPPRPVTGTDGRRHLVYEILLANREAVRLDVTSLAVRTAGGRTLRQIGAPEVPGVLTTAAAPASGLGAGEGATVWIDLPLRRGRSVPRALVHRIAIRATLPDGTAIAERYDVGRTRVLRRRMPAIAPPLRGGLYMNFNGCCELQPHRVAIAPVDGVPYLSERFAVDFIRIDAAGSGGAGDLTRNESFFTYNEPVYAVGDARVVSTLDDVPENVPLIEPPNSRFTMDTLAGNSVILRLADGRYAAYAHLRPGSIRVRPGQRVRRGQMLARVGNSGQSGGPHLHFQLSDGPQRLASDGLPLEFRRFSLIGTVANVGEFLTGQGNADIRRLARPSLRRGQLPMHATVVRFPG